MPTRFLSILSIFFWMMQTPLQAAAPGPEFLAPPLEGNPPAVAPETNQNNAGSPAPGTVTTADFLSANALSPAAAEAEPRPFLGVEQDGTVSGYVEIRPNPDELPGIRKVAYYLNGRKSGKVYQSPFIWGGPSGNGTAGFDTTTIADGSYTLSMAYTDASGDHTILIRFTVDNTGTQPPLERGDPDENIWGVENGETVKGTVSIYPNFDRVPAGSTVTWTLEGQAPVTVTEQPYFFGGASGNGTQPFDTTSVPDGIYRLSMNAQVPSGSAGDVIVFRIDNEPDNPPAATPIAPSGRTLGGETFPAGTSFADVDQAGNFSFLADAHSLYLASSSNPANPQVLSAVDFNPDAVILDILAAPNGGGVFVLEKGPVIDQQSRDRLWFVNASNPSNPSLEFKADLRDARRLTLFEDPAEGTRVRAFYPSQGENFLVDCPANGSGACTTGFYNLYVTPDFVHEYENLLTSSTVGASYITLNFQDVTQTPTPAPVAFFSARNNYVFASLENGTTAVYDIAQADTSETGGGQIPVVHTINPSGNDPVFNLLFQNRLAVLDSTGLIEIFDITNPLNVTRVDSVTVAGARRLDTDGTNLYVVTEREYRIVGPAAGSPEGDPRVLGVTEGQTVSGVVQIRPNPEEIPGIRKAAYYLNGAKSGKVYQAPFIWGGPSGTGSTGFDTRTIPDGSYTLSMAYTDSTGDHSIPIRFTVDN